MLSDQETLVCVQGAWNGWKRAEVRLRDLEHVHWLQPSGAPRQMLHAYVSCMNLLSGDIPHECTEASGPHRLLVCVIKQHNTAAVYAEVASRATQTVRVAEWTRTGTQASTWA